MILCDLGASRGRIWTVHSTSEDWTVDRASRRTTIDARSWPDRRTIVARFVRDRGAFRAKMERKHRGIKGASIFSLIDVRSGHDRGLLRAIAAEIVARKKRKSCQKLRPIHGQHGRCDVAPRNRSHEDIKPPPRSPLPPTNSDQFPSLKSHVFLLCSSTSDRLVKKLSEFRGRSLVHRVPPAFRLDCEAIGAGLITNFSLISSNFPLEFRTSTRKNRSKFSSIDENWSPILVEIGLVLRFDRLSGGNLSFY